MKTIEIGTAVSSAPGLAKGYLKTGELPDGRPVQTPVLILRGTQDGPVLWLHACVHGNEYCGTFTVHELIRSLQPEALQGTVVVLPALNVTAFEKNQRMSPFEGYAGGDLNRCFPGRADGSFTQQIAHAVYTELRQHATYFIDLHTAMTPDVRWALFPNAPGETGRVADGIARAFGFSSTLPAPMDILVGAAAMSAAKDGIPAFLAEIGGKGPSFTDEAVNDAAERLRNVMRHLGMLDGAVTQYSPILYFSNFAWVHATKGGLFQRCVLCGDMVEAGQVIGHYHDLYGDPAGEARSPEPGIVLAIHSGPIMATGETLIHVGLNPQPA
jgi:predicted deacylase